MERIDRILAIIDEGLERAKAMSPNDLPRICRQCRRKTAVDEGDICAGCAALRVAAKSA